MQATIRLPVPGIERARWIEVGQGDIARARADAIVTSANEFLAGGSGVDEAIRLAAGPAVDDEIARRDLRCPTGQAVITGPGELESRGVRWIVHAVGPVWEGGNHGELEALRAAYRSAISVADGVGAKTIAVPAISCGAFGFPAGVAATIALDATRDGLAEASSLECVEFVLMDPDVFSVFRREAGRRVRLEG